MSHSYGPLICCLGGETAESTPVLYGPLITADIYNGECFKSDEKRSFKMETLEPWLAFTVKIPLVGQDGNLKGLCTSTDLLRTSISAMFLKSFWARVFTPDVKRAQWVLLDNLYIML